MNPHVCLYCVSIVFSNHFFAWSYLGGPGTFNLYTFTSPPPPSISPPPPAATFPVITAASIMTTLQFTENGSPSTNYFSTTGMAFDSFGAMFLTDYFGNNIMKVVGGAVETYLGTSLSYPYGSVAFNAAGNMFIADSDNHVIRMVSLTSHRQSMFQ